MLSPTPREELVLTYWESGGMLTCSLLSSWSNYLFLGYHRGRGGTSVQKGPKMLFSYELMIQKTLLCHNEFPDWNRKKLERTFSKKLIACLLEQITHKHPEVSKVKFSNTKLWPNQFLYDLAFKQLGCSSAPSAFLLSTTRIPMRKYLLSPWDQVIPCWNNPGVWWQDEVERLKATDLCRHETLSSFMDLPVCRLALASFLPS